jgi:hypothetical protein
MFGTLMMRTTRGKLRMKSVSSSIVFSLAALSHSSLAASSSSSLVVKPRRCLQTFAYALISGGGLT